MVRGWHAGPALGGVFRDAVHACRWSPGVSLGIVATLALAFGANVTMYRVLDRLLLAPPAHIERPGEVERIYVTQTYGERTWTQAVMTLPDVEALSKVEAFSEVAAEAQREVLFGRGEDALRVTAKIVGGNYFRLLPSQIAGRARQEVLGAGDGLRAVEARPFDELLDPQRRSWRLGAVLFTLFGVLALVVAAVGLYGILAFEVAQRVPELGVRSALGATRPQLARLVLGRAVLWSGLGVVLGSALALAAGPRLAGLLFQTSPRDPAVMLLVVGVLLFVTFLAALLPARRATTVDPAQALRAQ